MNTMYVFLTSLIIIGGGIQKVNRETLLLYTWIGNMLPKNKGIKRTVALGYGFVE